MNKRGDVPSVFLVIITFGLVLTALISFAIFSGSVESQSQPLVDLMQEIDFSQKYTQAQAALLLEKSVTSCPECSISQLSTTLQAKSTETVNAFNYQNQINLYAKIRENDFILKQENNKITLTIPKVLVRSTQKENTITRTLEICIKFNKQTQIIENCQIQ